MKPTILKCVICGKEIIATNGDQLRKKYCNNQCRNFRNNRTNKNKCKDCGVSINNISTYCRKCMFKHRDFNDEKNPRYKNGLSAGYVKRLAEESVINSGRSLNICEICGKTYENRRKVQPHHKDRNRSNNKPDNLIVLCKSCHVKAHHNNY